MFFGFTGGQLASWRPAGLPNASGLRPSVSTRNRHETVGKLGFALWLWLWLWLSPQPQSKTRFSDRFVAVPGAYGGSEATCVCEASWPPVKTKIILPFPLYGIPSRKMYCGLFQGKKLASPGLRRPPAASGRVYRGSKKNKKRQKKSRSACDKKTQTIWTRHTCFPRTRNNCAGMSIAWALLTSGLPLFSLVSLWRAWHLPNTEKK